MKYSLGKGIFKGIITFILFAIPMVIANFPQIADLTIGTALVILANFLKVKYLI